MASEAIEVAPQATVTALVRYDVTPQQIQELRTQFSGLTFETPTKYEEGRKAIATLRELRVAVEKKRVALKASALAYGRKVDSVAEQLTVELESIEQPLKLLKAAVDDEAARVKAEAEAAKKAALEAKIRAEREAEEARLRAEREAAESLLREEQARLELARAELAEQKRQLDEAKAAEEARQAEAKRLRDEAVAAEQKQLDDERAELARQQRALAEAQAKAEQEASDRIAKLQAEKAAAEKAERERLAAEQEQRRAAAREAERKQRLEALKPDAEKLHIFAQQLCGVTPPDVASPEAQKALRGALAVVAGAVVALEAFGVDPKPAAGE